MISIRVPERGFADVPSEVWARLALHPAFWRLCEQGIVSVSRPSRGQMRLHGGCFVGKALVGDVAIEVHEKIDGALRALLGYATHSAFRVEREAAPASELGDLAPILVKQFLDAVSGYASRGREFQYTSERHSGSLVGGRLDITQSLKLRARGLRHLLVFHKNTLSYATSLNRVVLAALREVEKLARVVPIPQGDVARARGFSLLFSDCRDAEVLFGPRDNLVRLAQEVADSRSATPVQADLASLAGVLLAHESFELSASTGAAPRAWFLNLETLFEAAVLAVTRDLGKGAISVSHGRKDPLPIFSGSTSDFRANPDLVIRSDGKTLVVGDVKYKTWDGTAGQSDVYQLLVHAATFAAPAAFLVFPDERFAQRSMGMSATGQSTELFAVNVRNLDADLRRLLVAMGVIAAAADACVPVAAQN